MKTATYTLPAQWASALINADYSGITEEEAAHIADFFERNAHLHPALDVGEPYIGRHIGKLCDVADYVFPY